MTSKIRVAVVDDHPLMREGLISIIDQEPDMRVLAEAPTGGRAIELYREHQPNVMLMDLSLPDMSGCDALIRIRAEFPRARIIILTSSEGDAEMRRALAAGAQGYLLKRGSVSEIIDAIRQVHLGKKRIAPEVASKLAEHMADEELTTREVEVLQLLPEGNRNRDIGYILSISEETVKVHVKRLMEKLGASDRTEALTVGLRRGFVRL